jgi:hypothetical protein
MAISSLSKLGVPLQGDQSASNQGLLMPKLQYRYRVLFENLGVSRPTTELTKQVMSAGRPSVDFQEITLDTYNSKVKLAGKPSWSDIEVVVRDDVTGAVSRLVGEQVQKQFDFFEQSSAASGIDYKFTTKIELLDGGNGVNTPVVLETFELYGCFLQKAAYLGGDYKNSDPLTITLTIRYDNALQVNAAGQAVGIGAQVGRTIRTLATGGG